MDSMDVDDNYFILPFFYDIIYIYIQNSNWLSVEAIDFFFPSNIRFFLAREEKKSEEKKCEKELSEEKLKRSEEKASISSDFRIVRVKNPGSKCQNCE